METGGMLTGLTAAQVAAQVAAGKVNRAAREASRRILTIVTGNALNPVNILLYLISLGLLVIGDLTSAVATAGLVLVNAAIGIVQEMRAKRQLDQIALLARSLVTLRRDGAEVRLPPEDIVLGDILVIGAGDQIPIDGCIVSDGDLELDESAMTGESDMVRRGPGDAVMSGSFCVGGSALVEATAVGEASHANRLTQSARQFTLEITPLQRSINLLLRGILLVVVFFILLAGLALVVSDLPLSLWLQILAVVTGAVSAGLLTLITLNYSWGAVRIGRAGGLVQQINAIESLSNVTVLCTDKTGTLTTNRIRLQAVLPVTMTAEDLDAALGRFAASATSRNKTLEAIAEALPGPAMTAVEEVPFSSGRKWSALRFSSGGSLVLGAAEMLRGRLVIGADEQARITELSQRGLRVLVLGVSAGADSLHDGDGEAALPSLQLAGILSFSDELRPHLSETLAAFESQGVRLKIISGDNPETVAALARQAGLTGDLQAVSGPELERMEPAEFAVTAQESTIFGRVSPRQKEALVDALRAGGAHVAMIGDGVNDVLSLKRANLGIAMESGSTATRAVAAMVLVGDSFQVMPAALREGMRIVNSIQAMLKLFMVTVFALLLLIIAITMLGIGFPVTTLQNTLLSLFARGVPPLVLALTASAVPRRGGLLHDLFHFTLPASLTLFLMALLVYAGTYHLVDAQLITVPMSAGEIGDLAAMRGDVPVVGLPADPAAAAIPAAQTATTGFFVVAGLILLLFARPAEPRIGMRGWIPEIVAGGLGLLYAVILALPGLRGTFDLVHLPPVLNLGILAATLVWAAVLRAVWHWHLLERFLGVEPILRR